MNTQYLNKITNADCLEHLAFLDKESIDLFLSDIPYGINLDEWDVLHNNTNSALLGQSPAQFGKTGFKRRGKPINGVPPIEIVAKSTKSGVRVGQN
jgi:site-specific DNA-methyltransferase (adenine-specific)